MKTAAKLKTTFLCQNCGYSSTKWLGRCPACESWNSFYEEMIAKTESVQRGGIVLKPHILSRTDDPQERLLTGIHELDRVLGGGIVAGSLMLLSGEPGIGKSTLTLHVCSKITELKKTVLYISGEESQQQVALRAERMGVKGESLSFLPETNLENIMATLEEVKPHFVVIDSIQVISSSAIPSIAGTINQVRFCTESLMHFAKKNNISVLLIGHVTKEGNLAGPRILEHLVDTVLFLEGERYQNFRILRGLKNRFGSTNEIGMFEMKENGLEEVSNASKIFLEGRKKDAFGSAITATVEGSRPLLLEVQALTNTTPFGYPKRAASGFDVNRLQLLLAVIEKHMRISLSSQDVYINVVGGFKLSDPAADLAVAMAVISSYKKLPLPPDALYLGEIGLSSEIRAVTQLQKRLQEAEKMGFDQAVIPASSENMSLKLALKRVSDLKAMV